MNTNSNEYTAVPSGEWTPGPWTADMYGQNVLACDEQMMICNVRGWGYLTGVGGLNLPDDAAIAIQDANARLIAAAPALYERLKDVLQRCADREVFMCDNFEHDGDCNCEGEKAYDALALAKPLVGETK